ncbi:hypothetical protein [Histophilus somni]|nr:hypothetical protein [Histophilus somni]
MKIASDWRSNTIQSVISSRASNLFFAYIAFESAVYLEDKFEK